MALVGYCTEMDERIICYEHAPKGRLSKYVQDASLTWMHRIKICVDVASGLSFLHKDDDTGGMIHSDIKSDMLARAIFGGLIVSLSFPKLGAIS